MHYFASLIYAWTAVGIGWIIFDLITAPKAWLNFTSWVWTLQSIFFFIYSIILKDEYGPWHRFLDNTFLPILFACEWATAVSVVYMMVAHAEMLENAIDSYGLALANIGSFIVHYLTLTMLIIYMNKPSPKKLMQFYSTSINPTQEYAFAHLQFLIICVYVIFYSYILVQEPATHYGIPNTSNFEAELGMIFTGIIGVLVFQNLPSNSAW